VVLAEQGPLVLFLIVLAEQLGLPLPAIPVLLAMGALAGTGRFSFATALAIAVVASLIADYAWYRLGRWRGGKVVQRRRFIRRIQIDRITPEELQQRLAAGEHVVIVDLRHSAEFQTGELTLPRALRIAPDAIEEHIGAIPRDREVILFCT
jgi:hypothetical protein